MKKCTVIALVLVTVLTVFSGCAAKTENGVVNVYNWGEYIDESIFDEFEAQYGIKVNYKTYETNEQLYSVLRQGGVNYDVIIPSDYMVSRLIDEGYLEELDFSNIPNYSNIDEAYRGLEYDPQNLYSVPYMWGTVGIIYNSKLITDEITSWGALFDEKYAGQILMFDNSRDAMGIALKYLGYSLNTTDEAELQAAYELLVQQKEVRQALVMDAIFDKLESGEAAIGPYYAGDYLTMLENNPDLRYVIPEEGSNLFVDAMCIPKGAANKKNAELFINFMCESEIAARNMEETGYASAVAGSLDLMDYDDAALAVLLPDQSVLDKCEVYINLPQETLDLYDALWIQLKL